jgi:hypothetical protein
VLERFGRRIGRQLAQGGDLVGRLRQELFSTSRGDYEGVDGIVLVRDPDELEGDEKKAQDRFESALIDAAKDSDVEVVGVEMTDTEPSNVAWFSDRGVASVDDLDLVEGKVALVYALLGESGRFGVKDSAERLLPPAPDRPAARR